jgi:hypothetical protein
MIKNLFLILKVMLKNNSSFYQEYLLSKIFYELKKEVISSVSEQQEIK